MFTFLRGAPAKISRISQGGYCSPIRTAIDVYQSFIEIHKWTDLLIRLLLDSSTGCAFRSNVQQHICGIYFFILYTAWVRPHCHLSGVICNENIGMVTHKKNKQYRLTKNKEHDDRVIDYSDTMPIFFNATIFILIVLQDCRKLI